MFKRESFAVAEIYVPTKANDAQAPRWWRRSPRACWKSARDTHSGPTRWRTPGSGRRPSSPRSLQGVGRTTIARISGASAQALSVTDPTLCLSFGAQHNARAQDRFVRDLGMTPKVDDGSRPATVLAQVKVAAARPRERCRTRWRRISIWQPLRRFEGAGADWIVEIHFAQAPDEAAVRDVVLQIAGESVAGTLTFATVHARDWVATSLAGLHPVAAGRFIIHGAHDRARVLTNRIGIEIEAAPRSGPAITAPRAAARSRSKNHQDAPAAASWTSAPAPACSRSRRQERYAGRCWRTTSIGGSDRRQSERACDRAGSLVAVVHAAGLSKRCFQAANFDLVFANILLGPLKSLATPMTRVLAPDAYVVLSGLLPRQANAALSAYRVHGWILERRIVLDGWMTLVLARRPARAPAGTSLLTPKFARLIEEALSCPLGVIPSRAE